MRDQPKDINPYRIVEGKFASTRDMGCTGAFKVPVNVLISSPYIRQGYEAKTVFIISDDGRTKGHSTDWEHVSVSLSSRDGNRLTPTWKIMAIVKKIFWLDTEVVMQIHPAEDDYVNVHSDTLHMWKPINHEIPTPPTKLV